MTVNFLTRIPGWEASQLTQLQNQGALSGVSAQELAVIDTEESGGSGGGVNSIGDGGWFGLQESATYFNPAGQSFTTSPALLKSTSTAAFDTQAQAAAAAFATLLNQTGNPLTAEAAYQNGPKGSKTSPGQTLFEEAGITGNLTPTQIQELLAPSVGGSSGAPAGATSPILGGDAPVAAAGATFSGPGAVFQDLNDVLNPSGGSFVTQLTSLGTSDIKALIEMIVFRGLLTAAFIGITYIGFKSLTGSGASSTIQIINQSRNATTRRINAETGQRYSSVAQQREQRLSEKQNRPKAEDVFKAAPEEALI